MLGGLYLCYEGVEKLAHKFLHRNEHGAKGHPAAGAAGGGDGRADAAADDDRRAAVSAAHLAASQRTATAPGPIGAPEKDKIKGAVRTDFILSAEIIAITLGTVSGQPLVTQLSVLAGIAAIMTVGVYGLVAGIVKLDDAGLHLSRRPGSGTVASLVRKSGFGILTMAPYLMKTLSVVGTAAMFLVGGGILTHGIATAHHWIEDAAEGAAAVPGIGAVLGPLTPMVLNALAGIVAGVVALLAVTLVTRAVTAARGAKKAGTA
jgi:hypothetical protein